VCGVRAEHDPGQAKGVGGQAPAVNSQYVSFVVAAYIRELGYAATSAPSPQAAALAARAGLGSLSPEGRLMTSKFGSHVYVSEVIRTDLPLAPDG
jgi:epoxyqueuosine reductase QueG